MWARPRAAPPPNASPTEGVTELTSTGPGPKAIWAALRALGSAKPYSLAGEGLRVPAHARVYPPCAVFSPAVT
jgi:hypothetical protein